MEGIAAGSLYTEGEIAIKKILDFSMKEYPGEHSRAVLEGFVDLNFNGHWEFEEIIGTKTMGVYARGKKWPVYIGIIQETSCCLNSSV